MWMIKCAMIYVNIYKQSDGNRSVAYIKFLENSCTSDAEVSHSLSCVAEPGPQAKMKESLNLRKRQARFFG